MSAMDQALGADATTLESGWTLPDRGKVGIIFLIITETSLFAMFVAAYLIYIGKSVTGPYPKDVLEIPIISTICLLSSSFTVYMAEHAVLHGAIARFKLWLFITIALGLEFFSEKPAEPDPWLLDVVADVGSQLGHVVDRVDARRELEASKRHLERIIETSVEALNPNLLVLHIQPDEGVSLRFGAKVPGPVVRLGTVTMDMDYQHAFGNRPSTGYERLLYDCMIGDATLFQRADMTELTWGVVAPIQEAWQRAGADGLMIYPAGSWGPAAADALLSKDGRQWREREECR